ARSAATIANGQRQALTELRDGWRMHVAENSKAAGAEMAQRFGEGISAGIERRLATMAQAVDEATRRLGWIFVLKWSGAIAAGIALSITLGVWALLPHVDGLSTSQVQTAVMQLKPCQLERTVHVCTALDDTPQLVKSRKAEPLAVVRGM